MQVVVFTENNARIITNPSNPDDYINNIKAVIDPDLTQVHGVPPHFWKLNFGRIESMDDSEKAQRLSVLELDKTNTYSINEMFLRVSKLQQEVSSRDIEITRLNDQYIEVSEKQAEDLKCMQTEHSKNMSALKSTMLYDLNEERVSQAKLLDKEQRTAKRNYYVIMVLSTLVGGLISWMVQR